MRRSVRGGRTAGSPGTGARGSTGGLVLRRRHPARGGVPDPFTPGSSPGIDPAPSAQPFLAHAVLGRPATLPPSPAGMGLGPGVRGGTRVGRGLPVLGSHPYAGGTARAIETLPNSLGGCLRWKGNRYPVAPGAAGHAEDGARWNLRTYLSSSLEGVARGAAMPSPRARSPGSAACARTHRRFRDKSFPGIRLRDLSCCFGPARPQEDPRGHNICGLEYRGARCEPEGHRGPPPPARLRGSARRLNGVISEDAVLPPLSASIRNPLRMPVPGPFVQSF